jgi:hypothetical protein
MIKLFRKIRHQLLTENRFSKYLLYAIGEIVLVVIGILIALQINNWNESKKLSETTQIYYKQLLKDLASDKLYISDKIAMYKDRTTRYNSYKEIFNKPKLTAQEVLETQYKLDFTVDQIRFQNNTIVSLESTGDIKLIPLDIGNGLMDLKKRQDLIIEFTKSNYDYYMAIIRTTGLAGSIPGFEGRLKNQPELRKILNIEDKSDTIIISIEYAQFIKNYSEGNMINRLNEMLIDIDKITRQINSELNK